MEAAMESREWIGQSRARNAARGEITGASQFFIFHRPGFRDAIGRQILPHGMTGLHGRALIQHETEVYRRGEAAGLPLPRLIATDNEMCVTELVGPSLRMLIERPDLPVMLTEEEVAALVVNTLHACNALAEAGFVPLDGHLHNFWVWLENGLEGGSLEFDRVVSGDHTYSLVRGMECTRPLWCSTDAAHFPPEARALKLADDAALARVLNRQGLDGDTLGDIVRNIRQVADESRRRALRWRLEQTYSAYNAPQQLQTALDSGIIEPHRMLQYSVGRCLLNIVGANLPEPTALVMAHCRQHLDRMADIRPEARFPTLGEAAQAIATCWGSNLPQRSYRPWPPIPARFLIWDVRGGTDPEPSPSSTSEASCSDRRGTFGFDEGHSWDNPAISIIEQRFHAALQRLPRIANWVMRRPVQVLFAMAMAGAVVAGMREPPSPEEALYQARKIQAQQFVEQACASDQVIAARAIRQIKIVLATEEDPLRKFVIEHVEKRYLTLEHRHLNKPLISKYGHSMINAQTDRSREIVRELEFLADMGHVKAKHWLRAYQQLENSSLN